MSTHEAGPVDVAAAWDAIAEGFDRRVTPHGMAFGAELMDRLPLGPGTRVVDVGAGTGALSIPAARTGSLVTAVDISPAMIARLAARGHEEGLANLTATVGDGTALAFDDATFDVAVSMNGVSLIPELTTAVDELVRVTRPGGTVMLVTFGPLPRVEFLALPLSALRVVGGDEAPDLPEPLPPFRLAEPTTFERTLLLAGLDEVAVTSETWHVEVPSAQALLDMVLTSNPIAGHLAAGLDDDDLARAGEVLDGLLRRHGEGSAATWLRAEMHIGTGRV